MYPPLKEYFLSVIMLLTLTIFVLQSIFPSVDYFSCRVISPSENGFLTRTRVCISLTFTLVRIFSFHSFLSSWVFAYSEIPLIHSISNYRQLFYFRLFFPYEYFPNLRVLFPLIRIYPFRASPPCHVANYFSTRLFPCKYLASFRYLPLQVIYPSSCFVLHLNENFDFRL